MKTAILGVLSIALSTLPAMADVEYDRSIEAAAIRIVAAKMGELREGFAFDQRPAFVVVIEAQALAQRDGNDLVAGRGAALPSTF